MRRPSSGFTLLEALVAIVVLGTILVLLSQGFRLGLRGMAHYDRAVWAQSEGEPIARVLRQLIERMNPGTYPDPPQVRGNDRALAFTSEIPDPLTGSMIPADMRLALDGDALVLWWTPHAAGVPLGPPPAPQRTVLLARVERFRITYSSKTSPGTWISAWSEPALPAAVSVVVQPAEAGRAWPPIIVQPRREQAEE